MVTVVIEKKVSSIMITQIIKKLNKIIINCNIYGKQVIYIK